MAKVPRSLAGSVVAITGGARGIGRATAVALIAQGARVAIGDIEASLAEQTASESGAGTIGLPLDVTDRESFARFLNEAEEQLGPLDVPDQQRGHHADRRLRRGIRRHGAADDRYQPRRLDLRVQAGPGALPPRRRGHLVQIASAAGKMGFAGGVTYCATKHAVVGLSEGDQGRADRHGRPDQRRHARRRQHRTRLGPSQTRGFKAVQPEDVADGIVEALQTTGTRCIVPKSIAGMVRFGAMMPRRVIEAWTECSRAIRCWRTQTTRPAAAYEARMSQTIEGAKAAAAQAEAAAEQAQTAAEQAQAAAEHAEAVTQATARRRLGGRRRSGEGGRSRVRAGAVQGPVQGRYDPTTASRRSAGRSPAPGPPAGSGWHRRSRGRSESQCGRKALPCRRRNHRI